MHKVVVSEVDMASEQHDSGLVRETSPGVSSAALSRVSFDAVETLLVPTDASMDGDPARKALMSLDPNILVDCEGRSPVIGVASIMLVPALLSPVLWDRMDDGPDEDVADGK